MNGWSHLTMGGPVGPKMPTKPWNGMAIVGKAPATEEVAHGAPFSGKSGRVLKKILERVGIDPEATLFTNAFQMQPIWTVGPDGKRVSNDINVFFTDDMGNANLRLPPYRGMQCMLGPDEDVRDLWRLLRRERPKVIVACGSIALWALTGEETIGKNVGTFLPTACVDAKVMATWNTAHALHKDDEDIAITIAKNMRTALDHLEIASAAEAA